jgi:mono/diheme cytochrome c family protein
MNDSPHLTKPALNSLLHCCALIGFIMWGENLIWAIDENNAPSNEVTLEQRAIALLQEKCANCHGVEKREGEFSVATRQDLVQGGTLGTTLAIKKGEPSLLLKVIRGELEGLEMPPKNPLSLAEIELIQAWIAAGALWHSDSIAPPTTSTIQPLKRLGSAWEDANNPVRKRWFGERLNLWSLNPLTTPPIEIDTGDSVTTAAALNSDSDSHNLINPIDAFVDLRRRQLGIIAPARADKATLMRRLYVDLTGLPPNHESVQRFMESQEPEAYQRMIDLLLASPAYGEHFGRLWLDVIRYSDSNGFDWDEFRPQAWRFRNYIIDAWNEDLPYDQFVIEQLAGDELIEGKPQDPTDIRRLIATGFLRLGPYDNAAPLFNEQDRSRAEFLSDITETAGSAFLGQTLACCRCHDHKTDPWLQSDYYRFKAFFSAVEFGDQTPLEVEKREVEINAHNEKVETDIAPLQQQLDALSKDKNPNAETKSQLDTLKSQIQQFKEALLQPQTGLIVREELNKVPATFIFYQGDHQAQREPVEPGVPAMFAPEPLQVELTNRTTGRRLALAKWIASPQNPWTARVMVNRIWQFHFAEGLVRTPNDFGWSGETPESIELLDWLAAELIRNHWSIKHIQRLIVSSRTYQEATVVGGWPRKLKRLSAEQLRDSMLTVSGLMQARQATSPIWPPVPEDVLKANPATLDDNETRTKGWYPSASSEQTVRSVYLVQKRTIRVPFMETFDLPDNSVSCGCRTVSIVAPQALSLLNGDWGIDAAEALARKIQGEEPNSASQQIIMAYQAIFQREPSDIEQQSCVQFLEKRTLAELTRALLNTNEFAFVE